MATKDLNTRCPLPKYFTVRWARQWIAAAGGDLGLVRDTWCWADFGQHYPELIPVFVEYLKRATTGDPAWAAYWAKRAGWIDKEDAVAVIKRATTGDPAWAAYWARQEGWMATEDAVAVIKVATIGDPAQAEAAHWARREGWMTAEDAVAVIKVATIGHPAWAAYWARRLDEQEGGDHSREEGGGER